MISLFQNITPVLPSANIERDISWYQKKLGFDLRQQDKMYAVHNRENLWLHLQWHAGTKEDPLLGGSVIKIYVEDINPLFEAFVKRGTITKEKLRRYTPWDTHEFGFFDLNKNAIFIVQDV
jgi:hypothetical protein